ncbi:hypothetical protein D3C71_2073920 [compost metagenome]
MPVGQTQHVIGGARKAGPGPMQLGAHTDSSGIGKALQGIGNGFTGAGGEGGVAKATHIDDAEPHGTPC